MCLKRNLKSSWKVHAAPSAASYPLPKGSPARTLSYSHRISKRRLPTQLLEHGRLQLSPAPSGRDIQVIPRCCVILDTSCHRWWLYKLHDRSGLHATKEYRYRGFVRLWGRDSLPRLPVNNLTQFKLTKNRYQVYYEVTGTTTTYIYLTSSTFF